METQSEKEVPQTVNEKPFISPHPHFGIPSVKFTSFLDYLMIYLIGFFSGVFITTGFVLLVMRHYAR